MAKSKSLVKDYMTKNVVTVSPQTTTEEVIKLMKASQLCRATVEIYGKEIYGNTTRTKCAHAF